MTVLATYTALLLALCPACGEILIEQPVEITIRATGAPAPLLRKLPTNANASPATTRAAAFALLARRGASHQHDALAADIAALDARRKAFGVVSE